MRIVRFVCLASACAGMLVAHPASAQELVIRLRRAGDTTQVIRNATVTIDHSIEAGNTDAAGTVRVPDLEDGGHIIWLGSINAERRCRASSSPRRSSTPQTDARSRPC